MLNVIIDKNIPLETSKLAAYLNITQTEINKQNLNNADALICRSVTKVNQQLLANTPVKFVGTASSGSCHFDKTYLAKRNIQWAAAAGCNANSVADYVIASVAYLRQQNLLTTNNPTAAIVGVGHVGQQVCHRLQSLGFNCLLYDPPRAQREIEFESVDLAQISNVDLICLHASLTQSSYHLVNKQFLQQQKPGAVILNAARGEIIDSNALKQYGKHCHWVLDVYENEPNIDSELVTNAIISTPHIAGHAVEAKWRASAMIIQKLLRFAGLQHKIIKPPKIHQFNNIDSWEQQALELYNPYLQSEDFKTKWQRNSISAFIKYRINYPIRHEWG